MFQKKVECILNRIDDQEQQTVSLRLQTINIF